MAPEQPKAPRTRSSRFVITALCTPAVLAVVLFSFWDRPAGMRQRAIPALPGGKPDASGEVLGALELGAMRGWVLLGEYQGARWVTRYFSGWGDGLPVAGTVIQASEPAVVRDEPPDVPGKRSAISGRTTPGERLAIVQLRVAENGGPVWARVASPR